MDKRRIVSVLAASALLAGCGGSSYVAPPASNTAARVGKPVSEVRSDRHRRRATLTIHIRIPRHRHRHRAQYVSAGTKGMTLQFSGPTNLNETVGLTPVTNPNCSGPKAGPFSCTIQIELLSGNYTGSISTYDNVSCVGSTCTIPGGANLLSTAKNVPFTIAANMVNNVGFTLAGIPASLAVSGLPSGTIGTSFGAPQQFAVTAKDADGFTIVGPYDTSVTLNTSDGTNAAIATSGSDNPPAGQLLSSSDVATLDYTGGPIASATIGASATGATGGNATFTPAPVLTSVTLTNAGGVGVSDALIGAETVITLNGQFATGPGSNASTIVYAFSGNLSRVTYSATQITADLFLDPHTVAPGSANIAVQTSAGLQTSPQSITNSTTGVDVVTLNTDTVPGSPPGTGTGKSGDLRHAILNAAAGDTIVFDTTSMCNAAQCTILLGGPLPPVAQNLTIDGGSFLSGTARVLIDGGNIYRAFWAESGTVTIANLQIQFVKALGGSGGGGSGSYSGGGGGAGLGGGLFVDAATVNAANDYFLNNDVRGGNGGTGAGTQYQGPGAAASSGGGGLGGNGGAGATNGTSTLSGGGGGGITGAGSAGNASIGGNGGAGFTATGGTGGLATSGCTVGPCNGGPGGYGGGGGGAGGPLSCTVIAGCRNGGAGGFGGGGGGSVFIGELSGKGGFGGGSGGGDRVNDAGPGGGGGGGAFSVHGTGQGGSGGSLGSSVVGGNGDTLNGGGGAAAGPAIFVTTGALTTSNSGASGSTAFGGTSGGGAATAGTADATPVFNFGGTVNGSTTKGPIASALSSSQPQLQRRSRGRDRQRRP